MMATPNERVTLHLMFRDGSNPYVKFCKDTKEAAKELRRWKRHYNVSGPVSANGTVRTYLCRHKGGGPVK